MSSYTDPVCGMVVVNSSLRAEGYEDVVFCSEVCQKTFMDATARYGRWQPRARTAGDGETTGSEPDSISD